MVSHFCFLFLFVIVRARRLPTNGVRLQFWSFLTFMAAAEACAPFLARHFYFLFVSLRVGESVHFPIRVGPKRCPRRRFLPKTGSISPREHEISPLGADFGGFRALGVKRSSTGRATRIRVSHQRGMAHFPGDPVPVASSDTSTSELPRALAQVTVTRILPSYRLRTRFHSENKDCPRPRITACS
jgi:hypothetical protein